MVEGMKNIEHPLYSCWKSMIRRCTYPSRKEFYLYGARGITVDPDWRKFENFFRDMGNKPSKNHSLDRIDNDKGYSKENCRWATSMQQARNKRLPSKCRNGHAWTELSTIYVDRNNKKSRKCKICLENKKNGVAEATIKKVVAPKKTQTFRLSSDDVAYIRKNYIKRKNTQFLADKFGVSKTAIYRCVSNITYNQALGVEVER